MALETGSKLGHYEILSSLGAGGMGEVYRAKNTKLGREVAIKLLLEEVLADSERLARFGREARVLASLNHPNIATLHGFETQEDTNFLVMELVEGETLADRIARGPIPVDEAIPLFIQIAEGLEAAHDKGVIHRDLKPANVKVSENGTVKILDFGLAKVLVDHIDPALTESPTLTLAATRRGQILGTAAYMSPEQGGGKEVGRRTDVWAFGICLFEALSGVRPFRGETSSELFASVLKEEPEWSALPEATSPSLRRLLRRCLAKDANNRLHDIADARIELHDICSPVVDGDVGDAVGTQAAAPPRRGLAALALGFVLGGGVIGGLFLVWTQAGSGREASTPQALRRYSIVVPSDRPVRAPPSLARNTPLRVSPDGRWLVYVAATEDGGSELRRRRVDEASAVTIPGTKGASAPFFSPDSSWLAFWIADSNALMKVAIDSNVEPQRLSEVNHLIGGSWGADGVLYLGTAFTIERVSARGGRRETVVALENEAGLVGFPELLPGGRVLLYSHLVRVAVPGSRVRWVDLETRQEGVLGDSGWQQPRYVASGHLIVRGASGLLAVPFDAEGVEITGPAVDVTPPGILTGEDSFLMWDVAPQGALVYIPSAPTAETAEVVFVATDGTEEELELDLDTESWAVVSPDGQRVVYQVFGASGTDLWIYDVERRSSSRFTFHEGTDHIPVFVPNGREVIFISTREGSIFNLYRKRTDGFGGVERLTDGDFHVAPHSFSPDGRTLLHYGFRDGSQDIFTLDLDDGGHSRPLLASPANEMMPSLSPDGRWLAYDSDESGRSEVYVRPYPALEEGQFQISLDGGELARWGPQGDRLYYQWQGAIFAVDIETQPALRAGVPAILLEDSAYRSRLPLIGRSLGGYFDLLPDGRGFFVLKASALEAGTEIRVVEGFVDEVRRLTAEAKR